MKKTSLLFLVCLVITGTLLTSCDKDDPLNMEADIVLANIENAEKLLLVSPKIDNNEIVFRLIEEPKSYTFAPTFTLSSGATISPESGFSQDFTSPKKYVVTSEDGKFTKEYTVSFIVDKGVLLEYSFEDVEVKTPDNPVGFYHDFYTLLGNGAKKFDWGSGNEGYNMLAETLLEEGEELSPAVYPTVQINDGYKGKGVKLQTKSTGTVGPLFGSPLAAGNLFLGYFKFNIPTTKSTRFGQPYTHSKAPAAVKGYFKYKAGADFKVNNEPSSLKKDTWDAYAILFDKTKEDNYLLGDHDFKDNRIVSVAKLDDNQRIETDTWTQFEINFKEVSGKKFDSSKEYMLTIVFSSSKEGHLFNGAVGSVLCIDEVEIVLAE